MTLQKATTLKNNLEQILELLKNHPTNHPAIQQELQAQLTQLEHAINNEPEHQQEAIFNSTLRMITSLKTELPQQVINDIDTELTLDNFNTN